MVCTANLDNHRITIAHHLIGCWTDRSLEQKLVEYSTTDDATGEPIEGEVLSNEIIQWLNNLETFFL